MTGLRRYIRTAIGLLLFPIGYAAAVYLACTSEPTEWP